MAHYDIFRDQLAIRFPAYGHALWEPSPGDLYDVASVGDVGYISEGRFHRLFNILLPADDPSHQNFGVPDNHEQFQPKVPRHLIFGTLFPDNFCSVGVTLESDGLGRMAMRPRGSRVFVQRKAGCSIIPSNRSQAREYRSARRLWKVDDQAHRPVVRLEPGKRLGDQSDGRYRPPHWDRSHKIFCECRIPWRPGRCPGIVRC
ncbi:hypothetical protein EI94DRAFT_366055 [Lactarius quietus]|nr:hypothetical protein EI94DRAFT_366055 [Lactarius quietus]